MIQRPERIIYTRYDGGVSIVAPSMNCMRWMSLGGRWADMPRGYVDSQIERQIAAGHNAHAAFRFAHAMAFGGCTDAEALEIIKDRDCGHLGTAFELVDYSEVPSDRWFRDAWRRSRNGGPIYVAMDVARKIQMKRMKSVANQRHATLQENRWRERIRRAETPEQLKNIWPKGLVHAAAI